MAATRSSSDDREPAQALSLDKGRWKSGRVASVGVTGTREIAPDQDRRLRAQVASVLARFKEAVLPNDGAQTPSPAMVSPLAEGADRLVAEEALRAGYALVAPLPFAVDEYVKDFAATAGAFRRLLADATVIELDGARGADETASYEAVGRFVVRQCDLLIAIWDGEVTGKRGGTAETTRYAVANAVPVWWLNALAPRPARWLANQADWKNRSLEDEDAFAALASHFTRRSELAKRADS